MAQVLVTLADGSEELEAITVVDLLRRADIEVTLASLTGGEVTCSRGTRIVPDCGLDEALSMDFDMVVLPGGMPGAEHLANDARLSGLLGRMAESGKYVTAICAAPRVLAKAGLLSGKRATCYPGFLEDTGQHDVASTGSAVERDGNIITSRAAGTAMEFALTLIEALCGEPARDKVDKGLVRNDTIQS